MPEYIEREALLNEARKRAKAFSVALIYEAIKEAPAADVVEVVHGRKIIHKRHRGFRWIKCPLCNHEFQSNKPYSEDVEYCSECGKKLDDTFQNYCPNCGAKMDCE